jgi:predicted DNA-binding ribbon-helix-helix protein
MKKESVSINLEHDLLHTLMLMAHEEDITLNQLVNKILKEYISKEEGIS